VDVFVTLIYLVNLDDVLMVDHPKDVNLAQNRALHPLNAGSYRVSLALSDECLLDGLEGENTVVALALAEMHFREVALTNQLVDQVVLFEVDQDHRFLKRRDPLLHKFLVVVVELHLIAFSHQNETVDVVAVHQSRMV
jgi:hypothetical protein